MQFVEPKVHMIASTVPHLDQVDEMLESLGVPDWDTDAPDDGQMLIEVAGRFCYKSFGTELNANLTKVREGNEPYIGNILKSKHGSVLEHATVSFAVLGVSRIFTHELVRHRAGTAFSQESGRFVRIDEVRLASSEVLTNAFWEKYILPNAEDSSIVDDALRQTVDNIEAVMLEVEDLINGLNTSLIREDMPFDVKKKITSFIRRFSPNGQVNDIIVTANHRAWRHLIAMRTHPSAEEEIRKVFAMIAQQCAEAFPNIYQDMMEVMSDNGELLTIPWYQFKNEKV